MSPSPSLKSPMTQATVSSTVGAVGLRTTVCATGSRFTRTGAALTGSPSTSSSDGVTVQPTMLPGLCIDAASVAPDVATGTPSMVHEVVNATSSPSGSTAPAAAQLRSSVLSGSAGLMVVLAIVGRCSG